MAVAKAVARADHGPTLRLVHGGKTRRGGKGMSGGSTKPRRSPIAVVLLVVLTVFGVAVLQAWVGQDGMHAGTLERELRHEQERLTLLSAQVAQLSSAARLRSEAEKLGLVADPAPRYLNAPIERAAARPKPGEATKRLTTPTP